MDMIAKIERENKWIAAGTTIAWAALILLLMFWISISSPIPPFEESGLGIEVALGSDDFGMGSDPLPPPSADAAKPQENTTKSVEQASETKLLTSEVSENVTAPDVKTNKENVQPEEQKPDAALANLAGRPRNVAGTGTGHGNTDEPGWMGDPRGNPNSNVYAPFTGPGGGIEGKITDGRKMIGKVAIYDDSQETGTVAVEILVDKYGKIIKAEPVLVGSTTTSTVLWRKAKEGLLNQKLFNESASGQEARGTILINFTVR